MTATIHVSRVDPEGLVLQEEQAPSESLTSASAEIVTALPLVEGETVWLAGAGSYTGWASVRRTWTDDDGSNRVELAFLPEPGATGTEGASSPARDSRSQDRLEFKLAVSLMRLTPDGNVLEKERTVTENVSPGGARVRTAMSSIQVGDRVAIQERRGSFRTWASVRGVYEGPDGITRLNLHFDSPLEIAGG